MKENYISKINKLGKIANIVVNIAKVITVISMILMVIMYIFLDNVGKGIVFFEINDKLEIAFDLREFGFSYSEVDRAQQAFTEELSFDEYQAEMFGDTATGFGRVEIAKVLTAKYINCINEDNNVQTKDILIGNADTYLIVMFIYLVFILLVLVFAGKFFKALRDGESPFSENVIKTMKMFAISLIPWGLVGPSVQTTSLEWADKLSVVVGINFKTIFVVVVILCMAYVFKYGAMLQQESDETL